MAGVDGFDGVVFDMDGLLLDSEILALNVFNTVSEEMQLGDMSALFMQCLGTNKQKGHEIMRAGLAGLGDHNEFIARWEADYKLATSTRPIAKKSGARELLDFLHAHSVPVAVATSSSTDDACNKLDKAELLHFFSVLIGGDQVSASKPEPDIYLLAIQHLDLAPANCLALEDSENGVKAALSAGMTVVQVPDLLQPGAALLQMGHTVLPTLHAVIDHDFSSSLN